MAMVGSLGSDPEKVEANPQMHLGAMLAETAERIATGRMGDVEECVLFVRGQVGAAIITLPLEPNEATIKRLETALHWMRTGELLP